MSSNQGNYGRSKKLGYKNDLRIKAIENGTVIDHIKPGQALNVLHILGVDDDFKNTVSIVMNTDGERGGKDVIKIEGRELTEKEVETIALLSPKATVNIIRDYEVVSKRKIGTPESICGIVKCVNPNCITNSHEPVETQFIVTENEKTKTLALRCVFCESVMTTELFNYII